MGRGPGRARAPSLSLGARGRAGAGRGGGACSLPGCQDEGGGEGREDVRGGRVAYPLSCQDVSCCAELSSLLLLEEGSGTPTERMELILNIKKKLSSNPRIFIQSEGIFSYSFILT